MPFSEEYLIIPTLVLVIFMKTLAHTPNPLDRIPYSCKRRMPASRSTTRKTYRPYIPLLVWSINFVRELVCSPFPSEPKKKNARISHGRETNREQKKKLIFNRKVSAGFPTRSPHGLRLSSLGRHRPIIVVACALSHPFVCLPNTPASMSPPHPPQPTNSPSVAHPPVPLSCLPSTTHSRKMCRS